jgi:hypothetical protein
MIRITRGVGAVILFVVSAASLVGVSACAADRAPTGQTQSAPKPTEVNPPGDIPDDQVFVPFTDESGTYSLTVPEGWARTSAGSSLTFTDKLNSVTIEPSTAPIAPTVDSVTQSQVPSLQSAESNFQLKDVSTFTRSGGDGVLVRYLDDSPTNEVTGKVLREDVERYVFWKAGQEVDLTLRGPQGADNVDPWWTVSDSFRWLQ